MGHCLCIGHFAIAFLLIRLFPQVSPLVMLFGVGFPDILWPILIFSKVENASINPKPRGSAIIFGFFPYSHSLVVTTVIASILGLFLTVILSPLAGFLFVLSSASHWFLDIVVHIKDMPILGFGSDKKIGLGLWNYNRMALVTEILLYLGSVFLLSIPWESSIAFLVLGLIFILPFAGSSSKQSDSAKMIRIYAIMSFAGFIIFALISNFLIGFSW